MDHINDDAELLAEDIADTYLEHLHSGGLPDRGPWLAAHPQIAAILDRQLSVIERIHRAAQEANVADKFGAGLETFGPGLQTPPPAHIGRYTILGILGHGASGAVYHAHDPKYDREVALKVLRPELTADPQYVSRFRREARIAAQLRHPHIVPIHASGEENGRLYLEMAFISGASLEARLNHGPLSFTDAANLIEKLADALHYAHSKDIVHRDVKPSNVLLEKVVSSQHSVVSTHESNHPASSTDYCLLATDYSPLLTDFGLARRSADEASLTEHGQVIGTLSYMPPEQAKGGAHTADARSDVYGLGAVFYRLLTGRVPFPGEGSLHSQVYHIVNDDPPKPRTVNPKIPKDLETICLKAMAKEPADRFATAAAMADELRRWQKDESLTIRPPTWWETGRRWARRNRAVAWVTLVASAVVLIVGGTLGTIAWARHVHAVTTKKALAVVDCTNKITSARRELRTLDLHCRERCEKSLKELFDSWKNLGTEDRKRIRAEAGSVYAATLAIPKVSLEDFIEVKGDHLHPNWTVAVHPSGGELAIGMHDGPRRWVRGTPQPTIPSESLRSENRPLVKYTPDGHFLIFASPDGGLALWNKTLEHVVATWEYPQRVLAVAFRENSVLVCCEDGVVQELLLTKLSELRPTPKAWKLLNLTAAAFNDDATAVAVGDGRGAVMILDGTEPPVSIAASATSITAIAWAPRNQIIAIGSANGIVELYETKTGKFLRAIHTGGADVQALHFTPDAGAIWIGGRLEPILVDLAAGRVILKLTDQLGGISPCDFSPDERYFAASSHSRVGIGEIVSSKIFRHLRGYRGLVHLLSWSGDGQSIVVHDDRNEVRVWDVVRGVARAAFVPEWTGYWGGNNSVALSHDGRFVAYASSGPRPTNCVASIHDTLSTTEPRKFEELEGGYPRLSWKGDGAFWLVREVQEPLGQRLMTTLRELSIHKPLEPHAPVIRRAELNDIRSYFLGEITPDGEYVWLGPRSPENGPFRVELINLKNPDRKLLAADFYKRERGEDPRSF